MTGWVTNYRLQACDDTVDSLTQQLPAQALASKDILITDKWIQCQAYKATSAWLKYTGSVFAWVVVILAVSNLFKPHKITFRMSKFISVSTIVLCLVGLHQVLNDAVELEMFSFAKCRDYSLEVVGGKMQFTGASPPLYCNDVSISGSKVHKNRLYTHLVITMNCYVAGSVLNIIACFLCLARPWVSREQMFHLKSTGPKGVYY
jgi:hypothetical protein